MALKLIFLEEFGKAFVPKGIRPVLRNHLLKAGIYEVPYRLFGGFFYMSIITAFILYFWKVYPLFDKPDLVKIFAYTAVTWVAVPLAVTVGLAFVLYFYLDIKIYGRTKRMEEVLPDFLRFVSENLKGGMSFEKALWSSIRPEFDILASEVRLAAKKVMTGQDVDEALNEFTSKYDSPIMKRSFDLMVEGIKGGGRIAELIDRIIEDIEETKVIKAEMRATNLSYMIFVSFVVILVTPGLFALSYQFLIVLKTVSAKIGTAYTEQSAGLPISFGKMSIETDTFKSFSRYALIIISGFSAIIVSIISKGNIKGGVKFIPIFVASSLIAYEVLMAVLDKMFTFLK